MDKQIASLAALAALVLSLFGPAFARAQQPPPVRPHMVVPIVGHVTGAGGSRFRSDLKLYNPTAQVISGTIVFTPRNQSGTGARLDYVVQPFAVVFFEDIHDLALPGEDGAARLTIFLDNGVQTFPVIDTSTYTATPDGGELGQSPTVFRNNQYFGAGSRLMGVLGKATERTNLFVMTGEAATTIQWTYREGEHGFEATITRNYDRRATHQFSVADLLGFPPAPNAVLEALIEIGSARIASSPVNNITNQGRWSDFKVVVPLVEP